MISMMLERFRHKTDDDDEESPMVSNQAASNAWIAVPSDSRRSRRSFLSDLKQSVIIISKSLSRGVTEGNSGSTHSILGALPVFASRKPKVKKPKKKKIIKRS